MKTKVKFKVPEFLIEILEIDCEHFTLRKEGLCNNILFAFSLNVQTDYQDSMSFENRKNLQFTLNKKNRPYYYELLQNTATKTESEILRRIFLSYAILPPFLREILLFREKFIFFEMCYKEEKELKLDTGSGLVNGKIERIFRDPETGYLKVRLKGGEHFFSQVRVIV